MNVWLFTTAEPLYLPEYLDRILQAHNDIFNKFVIAPPTGNLYEQLRSQFRFLGPTNFARMGTQVGRGKLLGLLPPQWQRKVTGRVHSVRSVATDHGVTVQSVSDVNDSSFVEMAQEANPDLFLSIICGQLLGEDLLSIPKRAINIHGSLLPKYRGRATAFWPLYYDDDKTGVTAHMMTTRFDAGSIIEQRSFQIQEDDTMDDLYRKLAIVGAELVIDLLNGLPETGIETRPNPIEQGEYRSIPDPEHRREFLYQGNKFI